MKKLLILLFSILISFSSSSGASDEPTRYVYDEFNIDNASKYTISTGDMHEFSCALTQIIFSQEALTAMKNNKKFDFMNSEFTPTSIDLYKNKVYWVDLDLNTKIKNNFVKLDEEVPEFELIHQDDELIFRIKTPHQGSTLVCDFPFRKVEVELDEDGIPVKTICLDDSDVEYKGDDDIAYLLNKTKPFTGKNACKNENGQIYYKGWFKDGKLDGKWTEWYENGQKWWEENYKDGKVDGKQTSWYENGQIQEELNWKDGEKDGKSTWWYENAQIKSEKYYKDGVCISGDC